MRRLSGLQASFGSDCRPATMTKRLQILMFPKDVRVGDSELFEAVHEEAPAVNSATALIRLRVQCAGEAHAVVAENSFFYRHVAEDSLICHAFTPAWVH